MANEEDKTVKTKLPTVDEIHTILSQPIKDPLVGKKLAGGRYEILEVLGEGGMSVVYKAKQELVDRIVAIKTLKCQLLSDPTLIKRFDREVKTLSRLNHPNIVTVYDCIVENGQPYFVMDYLQGWSLQDLLEERQRIPAHRARNILVQVCNAVEHAHRNGIVHRDLKPANIMLTDISGQEFVKVVDFGLAKIGEDAQRLTQTGELWGSPLYMSPEQCNGFTMDARSDIYSLGAVMYEALTGHPPFRGTSFLDTISKQVNGPTPSFSSMEPTLAISPEIEAVVLKALAKNPDQRYQSMAELKDVIERVFPVDDGSVQEVPQGSSPILKAASIPTRELARETAAEAATKRMRQPESGTAGTVESATGKGVAGNATGKVDKPPAKAGKVSESSNSNSLFAAIIGGLIAGGALLAFALINQNNSPSAPTVAPAVQPVQTIAPITAPAKNGTGTQVAPPTVAVPPAVENNERVKQALNAIKSNESKPVSTQIDTKPGAGTIDKPTSTPAKPVRKPHKATPHIHSDSPPTLYRNKHQSARELDDKERWEQMRQY